MEKNKSLEAVLVHELWCCKREFLCFINYASLLLTQGSSKEIKIIAFTSYGNYLRHLFSFYEGIIINRNKVLLKGSKGKENIRINELVTEEVRKTIRNKRLVYENDSNLDIREIATLIESEVPDDFGFHFRQVRNRFSHVNPNRADTEDISLADFFVRYHKYVLLLYSNALFSWDIKAIETYDWLEIENFLNVTNFK